MQMAFKHICKCTFKIKETLFKTMKYNFIILTNTNKFENVVLVRGKKQAFLGNCWCKCKLVQSSWRTIWLHS